MLYGTMPAGHFFSRRGDLVRCVSLRRSQSSIRRQDAGQELGGGVGNIAHVWEEPCLGRDRGGGGGGRGRADAALVVEGVGRVGVVDVVALDCVVVEGARRGGKDAEAQAGLVGVAQGEAAAV